MIALDELIQEFEVIGINPNEEVLIKCIEICGEHNITDAEEFVEKWMAYSISNLSGADPSVTNLIEFENKGLEKANEKPTGRRPESLMSDRLEIKDRHASSLLNAYGIQNEEDDEVADCLNNSTIIAENRSDSGHKVGQVIFNFGKGSTAIIAQPNRAIPVTITWTETIIQGHEKYLFDMLAEKANYQRDILYGMGKEFTEQLKGQVDRFFPVDVSSQQQLHCIGRIACESDTKLTAHTTMLIGSDSERLRKVNLNFGKCPSFAVFPGQIVLATGMNPNGDQFFVNSITSDRGAPLAKPEQPVVQEPLHVLIAAGPFSGRQDLQYAGLETLLKVCRNNRPDLLILIGPFLDEQNKQFDALNDSFETFFDKMLSKIMDTLDERHTQVIVVAAQTDLTSSCAYPTHPLKTGRSYPNLNMVSDPSHIAVDGVSFAFTATDILEHLGNEEFAVNCGNDKVRRTVRYLFNHKSFYPLSPPSPQVNMDVGLFAKFGRLHDIPNFLILPSDTKPFVRLIDGCLALNPGRTAEHSSGGSYARLVIHPKPTEESNIMEYVSCQILRV